MTHEINFTTSKGTVTLSDRNDDGIFDAHDVLLVDQSETSVATLAPEIVTAALATYGIDLKRLRGVHFHQLEVYLEAIKRVHSSVESHNIGDAERTVDEARRNAHDAHLPISDTAITSILQPGYKATFDALVAAADHNEGRCDDAFDNLSHYVTGAGLALGQPELDAIVKRHCRLEYDATRGDDFQDLRNDDWGDKLRTLADRAGVTLRKGEIAKLVAERRRRLKKQDAEENKRYAGNQETPQQALAAAWQRVEAAADQGDGAAIDEALEEVRTHSTEAHVRFDTARSRSARVLAGYRASNEAAFRHGETEARKGYPDTAKAWFHRARLDAAQASLAFDLNHATALVRTAYVIVLPRTWESASRLAGEGKDDETESLLNWIRLVSNVAGAAFDEVRANTLLTQSYRTAYEQELGRVEAMADQFGMSSIDEQLRYVEKAAAKAHIPFDKTRVAGPKLKAQYAKEAERQLKEAEDHADGEYIYEIERDLESARQYAELAGVTFNETEARRIARKGYGLAFDSLRRTVNEDAADGDLASLDENLTRARGLAEKGDLAWFDALAKDPLVIAVYANAYRDTLKNIAQAVAKRDVATLHDELQRAKHFAERGGQTFALSDDMQASIKNIFATEVVRLLVLARQDADKGDTFSVEQLVAAARGYASEFTLPFDEAGAEKIVGDAHHKAAVMALQEGKTKMRDYTLLVRKLGQAAVREYVPSTDQFWLRKSMGALVTTEWERRHHDIRTFSDLLDLTVEAAAQTKISLRDDPHLRHVCTVAVKGMLDEMQWRQQYHGTHDMSDENRAVADLLQARHVAELSGIAWDETQAARMLLVF